MYHTINYGGGENLLTSLLTFSPRMCHISFGSWKKSYEMLTYLLTIIQNITLGTKFRLEREPSTKFRIDIFYRVVWAYSPYIQAWPHLRPVISVDIDFLSGRYAGKLFMVCAYDADQRLLSFTFVVADEELTHNWRWFMNLLQTEVVGPEKIIVISDLHLAIRSVFEQPNLGWCETTREAVHRFYS
jgi:MULE transposase domain